MTDIRTDPRAVGWIPVVCRLPLALIVWALHTALWLPLFLLGLVIVPVLALRGDYVYRWSAPYRRTVLAWRSNWVQAIYGNWEDGIDGLRGGDAAQEWWRQETQGAAKAWQIIRWSALRNPTNGLRFTPLETFSFDPRRLRWRANCANCHDALLEARAAGRGGVFYLICWHGPVRAQFWLIVTLTRTRHLRIRVGDKQCMPKYRDGIPESDTLAKAGSWTPGQFSLWRAG